MNRRQMMVTLGLLLLLLILIPVSMTGGEFPLSFGEVVAALGGRGDELPVLVVHELRLPRMLLALLCGSVLALSGAVLQSVLRNDLASPDIIGISAGGGVAGLAVLLYLPMLGNFTGAAVFAGAFAVAMLIYFAAWKRGIEPARLILAGVAVNAIAGAISGTLLLLNSHRLIGIFDFTLGGLSNRTMGDLMMFLPCFLLCYAGTLYLWRKLDILSLGDENAASLGLNVEVVRLIALFTAAVGSAGVAGVAGMAGFVGLIAPHTVRLLGGGGRNLFILPASALLGAILMIAGDFAGRVLLPGREVPAGIFLAFAGALFFLILLLCERGRTK